MRKAMAVVLAVVFVVVFVVAVALTTGEPTTVVGGVMGTVTMTYVDCAEDEQAIERGGAWVCVHTDELGKGGRERDRKGWGMGRVGGWTEGGGEM